MRSFALLPIVFAGALGLAVTPPVAAQIPNAIRVAPGARVGRIFDEPRAVIGVTTTGSATNRDTLGVLVSSVRSGSPAEKAGIEEGNRIASVNGVSLKLAAADVGDYDIANAMTNRLTRELNKIKPGDEVELHVVSGNQTKTVRVKTESREDSWSSFSRRHDDDRATLGISIMSSGNARDSLGVLVLGVDDNGPAAKAGIEEGTRIASINGTDLREPPSRDTEEDMFVRARGVSRIERALQKVKPGDDVELRVYFNGQYRNLKVKTARVSDLPRHGRSMTIMRDDHFDMPMAMPAMPAMPPMPAIGSGVERLLERMPRMGNRVSW